MNGLDASFPAVEELDDLAQLQKSCGHVRFSKTLRFVLHGQVQQPWALLAQRFVLRGGSTALGPAPRGGQPRARLQKPTILHSPTQQEEEGEGQ